MKVSLQGEHTKANVQSVMMKFTYAYISGYSFLKDDVNLGSLLHHSHISECQHYGQHFNPLCHNIDSHPPLNSLAHFLIWLFFFFYFKGFWLFER